MGICIIGGGNGVHAMAAFFAAQGIKVNILTRQPNYWSSVVTAIGPNGKVMSGQLCKVSNNAKDVVPGSKLLLISLPSYAIRDVLSKVTSFVDCGCWVGGIPGLGDFFWKCRSILPKDAIVFGVQRVPFVSRIIKYGESVMVSDIRPSLVLGTYVKNAGLNICAKMEELFRIPISKTNNILEIAMTPSNPILHTSRLYALFGLKSQQDLMTRKVPLFYRDWDDCSSEILLNADEEVQNVCNKIPVNMEMVKSLKLHYDSNSPAEMTAKISSIKALQDIETPVIRKESKYYPDLLSRYFTEDFSIGLVFMKSIAEIAGVLTPTIDNLLTWGQNILGKEYLVRGRLMGKDVKNSGAIYNYGIDDIKTLIFSLGVEARRITPLLKLYL